MLLRRRLVECLAGDPNVDLDLIDRRNEDHSVDLGVKLWWEVAYMLGERLWRHGGGVATGGRRDRWTKNVKKPEEQLTNEQTYASLVIASHMLDMTAAVHFRVHDICTFSYHQAAIGMKKAHQCISAFASSLMLIITGSRPRIFLHDLILRAV